MAVQSGRHDIIQKLIVLGTNVDVRDAQGRFPLFYASSRGDSKAVHQLIAAGARVDDGSLHEAARDLHHGIVEQLVAAGHDPIAPSEHHGSRTALAELCLHARPEGRQWESKARIVIESLLQETPVERKYQDLESSDRKNILHLALDNPAGFEVVRCLLGFRKVWENLNSDEFLFEDSSSLCYSPTRYVQQFYVGSEQSEMKQKLIRLLKNRNCEDRFFKRRGLQPQGYIGLPSYMVEQDRRNLIQDQAHQEELRRIRERTELEIELSSKMAASSLKQEVNRQKQLLEYSSAQEAFENTKRTNLLEYNKVAADQTLSLDTARSLNEDEHADRRRQAEFSHSSRLAALKMENIERQARVQQQLLDRGDESVRRRGLEYRSVMSVAGRSPQGTMPSMPNLLLEGPD
jgi:ankyrin repeat domain-containing protein 50